MHTSKTIAAILGASVLAVAWISRAEDAQGAVQTIWNVGQVYETIVKMKIDVSNAKLTSCSEYKGCYEIPHLVFMPVLQWRTEDIRKNGVNYYGKRKYSDPNQTVTGIDGIRWKSDYIWINPLRWVAAWRMSQNEELKEWKQQNERLVKQIEEKGEAVESFAVFYTDDHKEVNFNPKEDSLLLNWSESSVANFQDGKQDDLVAKVYHAKISDGSNAILEKRGDLPKAEYEIQRKIVAECNVLASVLYDDPSGKRRSLLKNKREWKIDAGALNKGLLFYGGMNSLIHFEGTLKVRREPVRPSDCRNIALTPFSGDKIYVINSQGAKAGYHIGGRWQPFPLSISFEKRDDPNANMMEFWFDSVNNVLRYARIRIVKDDYDGDLPNPHLGKAASALKGSVKGRVAFELEYWTAVNQPLREM